jgi:hypothetical protein
MLATIGVFALTLIESYAIGILRKKRGFLTSHGLSVLNHRILAA